jgi:hypothetical protein
MPTQVILDFNLRFRNLSQSSVNVSYSLPERFDLVTIGCHIRRVVYIIKGKEMEDLTINFRSQKAVAHWSHPTRSI